MQKFNHLLNITHSLLTLKSALPSRKYRLCNPDAAPMDIGHSARRLSDLTTLESGLMCREDSRPQVTALAGAGVVGCSSGTCTGGYEARYIARSQS